MSSPDQPLACFKAYDIRGKVPSELNEEMAVEIGKAYVAEIQPQGPVAVGRDIRATSEALASCLANGITQAGVDVVDIGLCGTEMIYFAASRPGMGGGVMVTASHNPIEYNGMKPVRAESRPIGTNSGLMAIERRVRQKDFADAATPGKITQRDVMDEYVQCLLGFVDVNALKPLKIVVNAGNGCAGPAVDALAKHLPFELIRVHHNPDGTFPNGIPNPLLPENRPATADVVVREKADLGVAWDGDFDRCFLFDEHGGFIEGYYIVGLLAERMIRMQPGAAIVHDPRMVWSTIDIVEGLGGRAIQSKTGHSFMKAKMREEDAAYGGEMSAHHYFRDFSFSDSGMIPWLLIASAMSESGKTLHQLVNERQAKFPCSGEINRRVSDPDALIAAIQEKYAPENPEIDTTDGISLNFPEWRFNLRKSNTEPILRLNVESRGDADLVKSKTDEILAILDS